MVFVVVYFLQEIYFEFDVFVIFLLGMKFVFFLVSIGQIYGLDVEFEVSLEIFEFLIKEIVFSYVLVMMFEEIEEIVCMNGFVLIDGNSQVVLFYYVDLWCFVVSNSVFDIIFGLMVKVIEFNMLVVVFEVIIMMIFEYVDDIILIWLDIDIVIVFFLNGYLKKQVDFVFSSFLDVYGSEKLCDGNILCMGIMQIGEDLKIVCVSIYQCDQY